MINLQIIIIMGKFGQSENDYNNNYNQFFQITTAKINNLLLINYKNLVIRFYDFIL